MSPACPACDTMAGEVGEQPGHPRGSWCPKEGQEDGEGLEGKPWEDTGFVQVEETETCHSLQLPREQDKKKTQISSL